MNPSNKPPITNTTPNPAFRRSAKDMQQTSINWEASELGKAQEPGAQCEGTDRSGKWEDYG